MSDFKCGPFVPKPIERGCRQRDGGFHHVHNEKRYPTLWTCCYCDRSEVYENWANYDCVEAEEETT